MENYALCKLPRYFAFYGGLGSEALHKVCFWGPGGAHGLGVLAALAQAPVAAQSTVLPRAEVSSPQLRAETGRVCFIRSVYFTDKPFGSLN